MSYPKQIEQLERSIVSVQEEIKSLEHKQALKEHEINVLVDLVISKKANQDSREKLNELFTESIQDLRMKANKIQSIISLKQELVNNLINEGDGAQTTNVSDIWNQLKNSSFRLTSSPPSSGRTSVQISDSSYDPSASSSNQDDSATIPGMDTLNITEAEREIEKWEIDKSDINIQRDQKIGSGAFGSVYKGFVRGKEVAVKKLAQQSFDDNVLNEFRKEVCLMTKLRNPHLLLFMGACTTPGDLCIVTELMNKGSVHSLLRHKEDSPDFIDFKRAIHIARDCALGMNWLHKSSPPILHLDLKPANLLVDEKWGVKVADFGLSKIKSQGKTQGQAGSPLYMSPEMLLNKEYDEKSDVYSFSMLVWELLTKLEPYNGLYKSYNELVDGVVNKRNRPTLTESWPTKLKTLLQRCWDPIPARRPSFDELTSQRLLDQILIEGVLQDQNARQFWTHNFIGKEEVNWSLFYHAFCNTYSIDMRVNNQESLKIKCLKLLLVDQESDVVKIEDFGRFLGWFGPLNSGNEVLERVYVTCSLKGFLGDTSSKNVIQFLANKKTGTYIVRFSSTDPGCYALSYVSKTKEIVHAKIVYKPGQGYIHMGGSTYYPSLDELIKNTGSKVLGLKDPFEGGQFYALFYASKHPTANVSPAYIAVTAGKKV